MAAPTTWSAPASGGTVADATTDANWVSYAGGYWFALTLKSGTLTLRVASDPAGAWTTATLPANPASYAPAGRSDLSARVSTDGTTWAFTVLYYNGGAEKSRIVYATTPTGTWSAHEFDATDTYRAHDIDYLDGQWVIVGGASDVDGSAFTGTCSTITGTWAINTSEATTGYDPSAAGFWTIRGVGFDGSTWVTAAYNSFTGACDIRYSSAFTSGWAAPASVAVLDGQRAVLRRHANGWWTISDNQADVAHTDNPSGTWSLLTDAQLGLGTAFYADVVHGSGHWLAVRGPAAPRISYYASASTPDGTYTTVTDGFTETAGNAYLYSCGYGDGYFVAGAYDDGELRYSQAADATTAPTYLRQRQSAVRAPSRVRPVQLRQRQRPEV